MQIGRAHARMLAQVARQERVWDEQREAAAIEYQNRCAMTAAEYREGLETQRAAAAVEETRREQAEQRAREERAAAFADHQAMVALTRGPRTIDQMLQLGSVLEPTLLVEPPARGAG